MTPDTWGISGPVFLLYFGSAVVVVAILATLHRRALFAGDAGTDVERLGPQQIAYLNGRGKLAVYTSLGGLRAAGAIGSGPDKTLTQSGPLPSGVTPLDTAVYNAAGRRIRARDVATDQWVIAAIDQLRTGLEASGLAITAGQRRTARLWAVLGGALVAFGVARLAAGIANDKPVDFLVFAIAAAVIITVLMLRKSSATATRAADNGVGRLRTSRNHLFPGQSPAFATYGATDAAMSVALFGTASLYAIDPEFAAGAGIQQASALGSSGSGGGSSCSSGSSCGGGGGCGGGGCGG
jgi:uncharacterized protein (TIGR04222 family)